MGRKGKKSDRERADDVEVVSMGGRPGTNFQPLGPGRPNFSQTDKAKSGFLKTFPLALEYLLLVFADIFQHDRDQLRKRESLEKCHASLTERDSSLQILRKILAPA